MRLVFCAAVLVLLACSAESRSSPPKVQVYNQKPAIEGQSNVLICLVTNFHPPDISIELLRDGEPLAPANQTDLSFKKGWDFHLARSADFTPRPNQRYACRVTHIGKEVVHGWESNM